MRKFIQRLLISLIIAFTFWFVDTYLVNAETFTQSDRFTYYIYQGSSTPITSGNGYFSGTYGEVNRIQFLYSNYTYVPNYYYDITFSFTNNTGAYYFYDNISSCGIGTGDGRTWNCYLNKSNGTVSATVSDLYVTSSQSNLWINFYSSYSYTPTSFNLSNYNLSIVYSENTSVTGDDLNNATNNIINNQNQNQNQTNDRLDKVDDSLNDINDSLTDSSVDSPESDFDDFNDKLASNGVITQLIGLPVTLFSSVLNSVDGTCNSYNLGSLFGTDLILPCIDISDYLGSNLWTIIDILVSGLFVYVISRKMIKVFYNFSSMKDGDVLNG